VDLFLYHAWQSILENIRKRFPTCDKPLKQSHKAQNAVLQQIVTTNLKTYGKYKYWIIPKLNKRWNSMLDSLLMQILYLILNVIFISKISNLWINRVIPLLKWTFNLYLVGSYGDKDADNWITLISRPVNLGDFIFRDCSDFTKIFLIPWGFTSKKFTIATCCSWGITYTWINNSYIMVDGNYIQSFMMSA